MSPETQDAIAAIIALPHGTAVATVEDYLRRIKLSWQTCATSVLDVAAVCHEANERLSASERKALLGSALPFNKATFFKLVSIGRDHRLAGIASILPPSFTTIYEVALLSDERLEDAVNSNVIQPRVRRVDVAALRKQGEDSGLAATAQDEKHEKKAPQPAAIKIDAGHRYELCIPKGAREDDCAVIAQAIAGLRKKFGIEII